MGLNEDLLSGQLISVCRVFACVPLLHISLALALQSWIYTFNSQLIVTQRIVLGHKLIIIGWATGQRDDLIHEQVGPPPPRPPSSSSILNAAAAAAADKVQSIALSLCWRKSWRVRYGN